MFTKSQINILNYDMRFCSSPWITIIENENKKDDYDLYKLYSTNKYSISSGREYIAFPVDKVLSTNDYLKYNLMK
jgi:hypothetical protein